MSAAILMFTSRRAGNSPSVDAGSAFAALFRRWLDLDARLTAAEEADDLDAWQAAAPELDALRAAALHLVPITPDDMRRRVVICCDAPLPSDRGADAEMIREARAAFGFPPNG